MPKITESDLIKGVQIVEPSMHGDERGFFIETYRREWFPLGREMLQGNRGDRKAGQSLGCTTTCTKPITGTCRMERVEWCCTTCARVHPPTVSRK